MKLTQILGEGCGLNFRSHRHCWDHFSNCHHIGVHNVPRFRDIFSPAHQLRMIDVLRAANERNERCVA